MWLAERAVSVQLQDSMVLYTEAREMPHLGANPIRLS